MFHRKPDCCKSECDIIHRIECRDGPLPQRHEPAGSKYITPAGAARLRGELDQLWREERPRVTQAVAAAAAQGDRSENAEYTYGKRRLREIDRRVRFLRQRLEGMVVVRAAAGGSQAGVLRRLGAARSRGRARSALPHRRARMSSTWRAGYISMDSPLGRVRSLRRRSTRR